MKPMLVHLHIYYPEMWQELKTYLKNLSPYPYDLYVTFVENHKNIIDEVRNFKPEAKIEIVENRGFDVGPFIHVLNQVNLDDYSYLIKLHTKRDMVEEVLLQGHDVSFGKWRKYLLSFLEKNNFEKCLRAFEKDEKLGMCGNFRTFLTKEKSDKEALDVAKNYLQKIGYPLEKMKYIAGTMFIARASLFQRVKNSGLSLDDFETTNRNNTYRLAHALERVLGIMIIAQSYDIKDVMTPKWKQVLIKMLTSLKLFLYRKKVNSKGKRVIKICKIPFPVSKN